MNKHLLIVLGFSIILSSCSALPREWDRVADHLAGATLHAPAAEPRLTDPMATPTAWPSPTPSSTSASILIPIGTIPPPTPTCETHTASVQVLPSTQAVQIGEQLIVQVTLLNQGCVALGLPQYTLRFHAPQGQPLFNPPQPESVTHYLAVAPGQSDSMEFVLQGSQVGSGALQAEVSFEVHIGYPGPAYWGMATSAPINFAVVSALKPPDSDQPAAGICDQAGGAVATITINADVPSPRCVKVTPQQRLKYVNATGTPLLLKLWTLDVQIAPGQEHVFDVPVGEYLMRGVHILGGAEVWLVDS